MKGMKDTERIISEVLHLETSLPGLGSIKEAATSMLKGEKKKENMQYRHEEKRNMASTISSES
jgi:hypothetical protein